MTHMLHNKATVVAPVGSVWTPGNVNTQKEFRNEHDRDLTTNSKQAVPADFSAFGSFLFASAKIQQDGSSVVVQSFRSFTVWGTSFTF